MIVLAIDPGSERSGWITYNAETKGVRSFGKTDNEVLIEELRAGISTDVDVVVIEAIEPRYGLQMGWTTLDTARWIGRFEEAARPHRVELVQRSVVLRHLGVVTSPRKGEKRVSADAGIRQALIDRFGGSKEAAIGLKATPGPLYGLSRDVWAALSLAVVYTDDMEAAR